MKRAAIIAMVIVLMMIAAHAEVTVRFWANTAGVPDTLGPTSVVQIRGNADENDNTTDNLSEGVYIAWNANTNMNLTHVAGDYWLGEWNVPDNAVIDYKFFTNTHTSIAPGDDWEHQGWEANLSWPGGNRLLDLSGFSGTDTTLPLQYVNGFQGNMDQYTAPFTSYDSTFSVLVRVNVQGWQEFDPDTMVVGVRGSNTSDWGKTGEICWDTTWVLSKESEHANGGSRQYSGKYFYSGAIHVPNAYADAGLQFKFVAHYNSHDLYESWDDMFWNTTPQYEIPTAGNDTTIYFKWFDDLKPGGFEGNDSVDITFYTDLTNAITSNGFEIGDTLLVRYGLHSSADQVYTDTLVRQTGTQKYFTQEKQIYVDFGKPLYYQYYLYKDDLEQREVYFNFDYEGDVVSIAERRAYTITVSPTLVRDEEDSQDDSRRMPIFRNNTLLSQGVEVAVECDIRPAIYQLLAGSTLRDIQSNFTVTPLMLETDPDTLFKMGVYINGPLSNNGENTWQTWGGTLKADTNRVMYDDGTHGDLVAGDSIYTVTYTLHPDSGHTVGQEFKFGLGGGDNESSYGLNHIDNIDDSEPQSRLHAQWGSINPKFYSAWNYDAQRPSGITNDDGAIVKEYQLAQNFPNPFNPLTEIKFSIPRSGLVTLSIYNLLGQQIVREVYNDLQIGQYSYIWNGRDMRGNPVASGVYFYELNAGEQFRDIKKMVLMK
jgi:hypothetical protein